MDFITACKQGNLEVVQTLYSDELPRSVRYEGLVVAAKNHHYDVTGFLGIKTKYIEGIFERYDVEFMIYAEAYYKDFIKLINECASCVNNASNIIPYTTGHITKAFEATMHISEETVKINYKNTDKNVSSNVENMIIFKFLPHLGIGFSEKICESENEIKFYGRLVEFKTTEDWDTYYTKLNDHYTKAALPHFGIGSSGNKCGDVDEFQIKGRLKTAVPLLGTLM